MHPAFQRLVTRVSPMGNPARKYLRAVERHGERLVSRLEAAGALPYLHLDRTAPSPVEDFERVVASGRDADEKLVLVGAYYAVQFLHQNARALEQLAIDLTEDQDRLRSYAAFLDRVEEQFSLLISNYVHQVLRVVLPEDPGPFAILSVGSRGHLDDVDVVVIDGGCRDRAALDQALARLAGQCLRFASPLDNYVADESGFRGFCITPGELWDVLHSGQLGFVVVTELLRAEMLAGDPGLLQRVREEVTAEYLFRPGQDNLRHELFVRGLLGETRSLLLRLPPQDRVNPKDDGLRLILGLATAFRTIEGGGAIRPGGFLATLASRRPRLAQPLAGLERSRILLETFRQVAQFLVSQEEEITVEGEIARRNLGQIAAALGYRDRGPIRAVDHLLVHYHEAVQSAHAAAVPLMHEAARHLTLHSQFADWSRRAPAEDVAADLASRVVGATRTFRGVRFYDDLLEAFAAPGGALLDGFLRSYTQGTPDNRRELAQLYAEWGLDAPYAFLTILTLLAPRARGREPADPVGELADGYLKGLFDLPEAVRALSRVFSSYPVLMNRFLLALSPSRLDRLEAAIGVQIVDPEVADARDRFQALIRVHRQSSHYIRRVLGRVTARHPATVEALSDDAALRTVALGRLAASERHGNPEEQKGLLGDYYDIEFLRIAMGTLRGEPDRRARSAFAELTVTYLERLFDFCFRQVSREEGRRVPARERIGLFLAGGNARGRPYDEDYDLLALIDSGDPEDRLFAERVAALVNRQIARRGVVAQYRLGDHLGRFVTTLDELVDLLSGDRDDLFVDRCQILSSRTIVGGQRIEEQLESRVVRPLIFAKADLFAGRVATELAERRQGFHPLPKGMLHLKESPGGLRDIDLSLAIAKARVAFWGNRRTDPFADLARLDRRHARVYEGLATASDFFVAVRSAYRVTVAATDEIERSRLAAPARILGYEGDDEHAARSLFSDIEQKLEDSAGLVDQLAGVAASD